MTGALDKIAGPLAVKLINKFGKAITLIRVSEGTYDPATATTTNTETSETINGVLEDYRPYDLANGLAAVGDKKITVAAKGLTVPNLTDAVTVDSVRYAIVSRQTIYSGELPALYILQARQA